MKQFAKAARRHLEEVRLRLASDAGEGSAFSWALGLFFAGTLMVAVYQAADTAIGQKIISYAGF
ncbi:hypothetical protein RCO28_34375 [Streptomyces sp. LHD-70]|uniref:hypothetical protein n=1 Tax=Streptomyces sp. LHD-70 TaxID=3072140 RepID=UPI00280CF294|nr:hypothetical protein [Streptomyces sp. LHD-70]MDQ8707519.1 hypothetical protein [Streptomyces sp. LHD-70]